MEKSHVQNLAFQVISEAGDALDAFYQAIKVSQTTADYTQAQTLYEQGQEHLHKVHNIQTELITAEVNEEELPYSLIMVHAQDHLTSAINWGRTCKLILAIKEEKQ